MQAHYLIALNSLTVLMYVCMYPSGKGPSYSGPIR